MPCYAHGQVASVVCYAVLCHGRVEESSGDFPSDQGTGPEQQGTIWDKE